MEERVSGRGEEELEKVSGREGSKEDVAREGGGRAKLLLIFPLLLGEFGELALCSDADGDRNLEGSEFLL